MAQSVKLSDDIMKLVRTESERQSRSIAGQIAHWVRIGRAIETSGNFNHDRINVVLAGEAAPSSLSEEEHDVWLDAFSAALAEPSEGEEAFFEGRRQLGHGVGLDENGELVRETPDAAA